MFDGNFYDFGAFSECFHIERNMELYPTKYCMGQVVFDLKGISRKKSLENSVIDSIIPSMLQMDDNQIIPRLAPLFAKQ